MHKTIKDEILHDFAGVLEHIDDRPSDELESNLQQIVQKLRPLIHKV